MCVYEMSEIKIKCHVYSTKSKRHERQINTFTNELHSLFAVPTWTNVFFTSFKRRLAANSANGVGSARGCDGVQLSRLAGSAESGDALLTPVFPRILETAPL